MGRNIVLTGMILNVMPVGEYDRRITVLTKERGKITAFARGARRPASPLLAAANPCVFGEFEFFEGRSTYTLQKASVKNFFRNLTQDALTACYAFYFLEMADYYGQENRDEKELLKLLYQTMRALESTAFDNCLVRRIFELRTFYIEGEYPNFFYCQNCGKTENLSFFSVKEQGMLCKDCAKGKDAVLIGESSLYTLQYIISAELKKLYAFAVSKEVQKELDMVLNRYFAFHISHSFQSLEILKSLLSAPL